MKELGDFVKKVNYVLHGLEVADRPAPRTMFERLWRQIKAVPLLRRLTDKVWESAQGSRKRTFDWCWSQIAEELRERRHDMNYENVVKGLKQAPPHQLALPAADTSAKTPKPKGPKKGGNGTQPAAPGPVNTGTSNKPKTPCALRAAGHCRFGEKCRNLHNGSPGCQKGLCRLSESQGSGGWKVLQRKRKEPGRWKEQTEEWWEEFQRSSCCYSGSCCRCCVDGRDHGSWRPTSAESVAVLLQLCESISIHEHVFKVWVPILATLISSITNSYERVGEVTAASMVHPAVQNFRKFSLEFLGDTGGARDIGSLKALEEQGLSKEMLEPWIRTLDSPVRFMTGGGPQLSTEALRIYNKELGTLNMHLLSNCPMALSIGRQVAQGRTFVWEHGKTPYIALDHRRCRVWCPADNRYTMHPESNTMRQSLL